MGAVRLEVGRLQATCDGFVLFDPVKRRLIR